MAAFKALGNSTGCTYANNTKGCDLYEDYEKSSGSIVFEVFQVVTTVLGLVLNVIAVITLQLHNEGFPAVSKVLYQHQACLDALVCLLGLGMVTQSCMGMTQNPTIDLLLCQVWHSQAFYWTWVLISIWNIVYISLERFGMIHYPMRHRSTQVKYICRGFCGIYTLCFFFLVPAYFQVRYDENDGKCYDDYYYCSTKFDGLMKFFGGFWFFIAYALPIVIFISLYVLTICSIRGREKQQDNVIQKAVYRKANKHITRTAVAIAICFVLSQSPDCWAYLLNRTRHLEGYYKNSPKQTAMMFFAILNSCINPIIYCASLACFRTSLRRTLRRGFLRKYIDPPTVLPTNQGTNMNQSNDDSRRVLNSNSKP